MEVELICSEARTLSSDQSIQFEEDYLQNFKGLFFQYCKNSVYYITHLCKYTNKNQQSMSIPLKKRNCIKKEKPILKKITIRIYLAYTLQTNLGGGDCSYQIQYAKEKQQQMFIHQNQRISFHKKDIEIIHQGYANSFLDLTGINSQSLSFLLMRNQKLQLIKEQEETMEKKIAFPLQQALKISALPFFRENFSLTEFGVELEDLKNLIQIIASSNMELTFDDSNNIGDAGASGLGSALAQCTNLSNLTLRLGGNQIGDAGASGLGSALAQCTNLSNLTLGLGSNKIGDAGVSGLGSALAQCTNLSNLALGLGQKQFICCFGL
ncbi:hypothetical protein ABPG72_013710 [Tetrahymena utriculariae]